MLDVGCGTGKTACYMSRTYGCSVIGVDVSEKMVRWSTQRAERGGLKDKVQFRVADAQELPFEDESFDCVMSESVLAFVPDRRRAIEGYTRVVRNGGYVGLNEAFRAESRRGRCDP